MKIVTFHRIARKQLTESIRNSIKTMLVSTKLYRKDCQKIQNYSKYDICHTFKNCKKPLQTYGKTPFLAPIYILRIYMGQRDFPNVFEQIFIQK